MKVVPGALLVLGFLLASAEPAAACAVCYGDPNSLLTKGMNNGILALLGIVGAVQVGFVAFFWTIWKRSRRYAEHRARFRVIHGGGG